MKCENTTKDKTVRCQGATGHEGPCFFGGVTLADFDKARAESRRLSFDDYQAGAERTANRKDVDTVDKRLANFALGLAGEAGEAADLVKKYLFHGHPLDRDKIKKELGDVLWYVATMASTLGLQLEDVAQGNLDKLRARYPEGFSVERSVSRVKEKETAESADPKEAPTQTRIKMAPPKDAGE